MAATVPTGPVEPSDLERAKALLAQRRARDRAAGALAEVFGEPAWDLLLAMFVAEGEQRVLHLAEAVEAAGIRLPVARRWLAVMGERGLIAGGDDDPDPRLTLSAQGRTLVLRCVSEV